VSISVLAVLTLLVVIQTTGPSTPTAPAAAQEGSSQDTVNGSTPGSRTTSRAAAPVPEDAVTPGAVPDPTNRDADGHLAASIATGALPAGADFVAAGSGTWHVVPGTSPTVGSGARSLTYTVEVEDGLPAAVDQQFALVVDSTLADPRSWIGDGQVSFTRIDNGDPDIRISLTSQLAIRTPTNCGWDIPLEASCFNGWMDRVMINDARWVRGAMSYNGDIDSYRAYAVNHEVGHALGNRHQPCPANGGPAPIMMQQSWSTSDNDLAMLDPQTIPADGNVCVANPYPFPDVTVVPTATTQSPSPAG
jgi:Protein of unknown function (DUF3152)